MNSENVKTTAAACFLAIALLPLIVVDAWIAPPLLWMLLWGAICALIVTPLLLPLNRRPNIAVGAVYTALLLLIYLIPWNSRKPFLRDFRHIKPGMNHAQVETVMKPYIKGTGWPAPNVRLPAEAELVLKDSVVYRHATTGDFDSDWGIVTFENGKVIRTEFSPD